MRARFAAALLTLTLLFGVSVVAAPTAQASSSAAAAACPGNFFTRLGLVLFSPSYASYVWLRFC